MKSTLNKNFLPFENLHQGETAVVLATGPTLNDYDFLENDGNNLVVGVNAIAKEDIKLDYYFCGHVDKRSKPYLKTMRDYKVREAKFGAIGIDIPIVSVDKDANRLLEKEEAKKMGLIPYELTIKFAFERDISKYRVTNHLIIFSALQFLLFAGVTKIYLVGCDVTAFTSHKDSSIMTNEERNLPSMIKVWSEFKNFVRGPAFPEKVEIISINPIGLAGHFTDIYR